MRRILATSPDSVFTYGDPRGAPELRGALASYLARARAVAADPARIVIFNGFGSALSVLAATLRHLGVGRVALEDPCLPPLARIVDGAGLETVPVPVDDDGVRVDRLAGEGAILCTPAHQYPMGCSLSPSRRAALVTWARDCGGWIVEDDYDGEFRYDRRPLGAMQGLDPDRVVYGGTASKSLAPGLQLGWLVLPAQLVDPVIATVRLRRVTVSTIEQLTLADFIQTGRLDKHLRQQRNIYRRRRDLLVRLLDERAPWLDVRGISAGLHVTALVADRDEQAIQAVAARHGAALFTIRDHVLDQQSAHGLVIGYSRPADHAFPDALARLRAILDDC
jgi:GntR family transcriptional regulator/MocR family aminotransferase